jgi:metal-dependent amidase/aminoacylase/carboxypeptidase family protein
MAVLVGALRIMGQKKEGLRKRVMAVFQPGEEGREGAKTLF